jgi:hypothetical protein
VGAETVYDEGLAALHDGKTLVAFMRFRAAIALFLAHKNLDGLVRAVVALGSVYQILDMKSRARDLYCYACELAEHANLCVLTCCQTWWEASWGLGPNGIDDIKEANKWQKRALETADLARLDIRNLPRERRRTSSPDIMKPEVEFLLRLVIEVISDK